MTDTHEAYCLTIDDKRWNAFVAGWDASVAGISCPEKHAGVFAVDVKPPDYWQHSRGHWACLLGHRTIIDNAVADKSNRVFVFEDDAAPIADLTVNLPPGIAILGTATQIPNERAEWRPALGMDYGGWAYTADRDGLLRLQAKLRERLTQPWDMYWPELEAKIANPTRARLRRVISTTR